MNKIVEYIYLQMYYKCTRDVILYCTLCILKKNVYV